MRFFRKPTVGSALRESPGPILSDEERLTQLLENHMRVQKDSVGRLFSPLTSSRARELADKSKQANENI